MFELPFGDPDGVPPVPSAVLEAVHIFTLPVSQSMDGGSKGSEFSTKSGLHFIGMGVDEISAHNVILDANSIRCLYADTHPGDTTGGWKGVVIAFDFFKNKGKEVVPTVRRGDQKGCALSVAEQHCIGIDFLPVFKKVRNVDDSEIIKQAFVHNAAIVSSDECRSSRVNPTRLPENIWTWFVQNRLKHQICFFFDHERFVPLCPPEKPKAMFRQPVECTDVSLPSQISPAHMLKDTDHAVEVLLPMAVQNSVHPVDQLLRLLVRKIGARGEMDHRGLLDHV